jgi:predicted nicotinamide N-methyase
LEYRLRKQKEVFGGIPLEIECLESLDDTIDELFKELEKTGNASLLEELCPYFGALWPAARALSNQVASLELKGKRVLELGCGLAIPSLIASKLGADVTATDFHPEVPIFLRRNLALNHLAGLEYVQVNWAADSFPDLGRYDFVIGSDVLYERAHAPTLATVVERYLGPQGLAIIADPARPYLQSFVDEMARRGFLHESTVETVPEATKDGTRPKDVFLLKLRRAKT